MGATVFVTGLVTGDTAATTGWMTGATVFVTDFVTGATAATTG